MYDKILVPVDGSDAAERGLSEALRIAKSQQSAILLVHVVNELIFGDSFGAPLNMGDVVEALCKEGQKILQNAQATARTAGVESETALLESIGGSAADLIVLRAKEWHADLIVMGTHGRRGLKRLALGSDAEEVVRRSPVPVLLVRGAQQQST